MAKSVHYNKDGTTTKAVAKAADDSPLVAGFRKELKATFATGLLATRAFRMKQLCAFRDIMPLMGGAVAARFAQDPMLKTLTTLSQVWHIVLPTLQGNSNTV